MIETTFLTRDLLWATCKAFVAIALHHRTSPLLWTTHLTQWKAPSAETQLIETRIAILVLFDCRLLGRGPHTSAR